MVRRIDPVCGRRVRTAGAPWHEVAGRRYVFCGEACRRQFAADPPRFVGCDRGLPPEILREVENHRGRWFG